MKWQKELQHLEYSSTKDAAFCFLCLLFSTGIRREKTEEARASTGVKNWQKMKSQGKHKDGKLQHFREVSQI